MGAVGTDESARGTANIRGGTDMISFYAEADGATTDGPKDGTASKHASGLARIKGVLGPGHELFAEGLLGRLEEEGHPALAGPAHGPVGPGRGQ